jgi:hypothetical protein
LIVVRNGLRGERAAQNRWGWEMKLEDLMFGAALACLAGGLAAPAANAAVTGAAVVKGVQYDQIGPSVLTPRPSGPAFFEGELFDNNPADFDGGVMTFPGPSSPMSMIPDGFGDVFTTENGASGPALDAVFPTGTYTLKATNSSTLASFSTSLPYYTDLPPSGAPPELAAGSFSSLQNLDPHQALTLDFNTFTPDVRDTSSATSLNIFDAAGDLVFAQVLPASATDAVLPANTLHGGSYVLIFSFSNLIEGNAGGIPLDTLGVQNTFVAFTAVPEPRSWGLTILGASLAGAMLRRRRAALEI